MLYFRKFFRWHALAWAAYFAYVVLGQYLFEHPTRNGLWLDASFQLSRIAVFYFCYLVVYPRFLRVGRLPQLALGLGAGVLVFAGVRALVEEFIYPALLGFHNYSPDTTVSHYLFDNFYYALPNLILAAALWAGETALRRERENQQLTAARRTAELAFLKTQLNPHFLYNTLNALFGQAYAVDKPLANSIMKLSELMRYMLRDTPDGQVDLAEEVQYLENFLALYRLRYPGRLHAELTVTGDPAGHRVAPLLLIPFVENAFKHGVLDDPATPVRMQLALTPGAVEFTVENQRHDYQPDTTSGIGLRNLRRRLELLYPGRFACEAGPVGPRYRAHLRLDVPAGPPSAAADPMNTLRPTLATAAAS